MLSGLQVISGWRCWPSKGWSLCHGPSVCQKCMKTQPWRAGKAVGVDTVIEVKHPLCVYGHTESQSSPTPSLTMPNVSPSSARIRQLCHAPAPGAKLYFSSCPNRHKAAQTGRGVSVHQSPWTFPNAELASAPTGPPKAVHSFSTQVPHSEGAEPVTWQVFVSPSSSCLVRLNNYSLLTLWVLVTAWPAHARVIPVWKGE